MTKGLPFDKKYLADRDYRIPGGCGVSGIMNEAGERFSAEAITASIALMRDRSNGLGGGFAAYGIYPDMAGYFAFHLMYETMEAKHTTEEYLKRNYHIMHDEPIPTRNVEAIKHNPVLWRYFLKPLEDAIAPDIQCTEEDLVASTVMHINSHIENAFVASSGKDMGIFKGVGYPEDIAEFFRLDEYKGYMWTAHGRFPTNSVAWWGGAHPFGLLDWSIVHNGEISSYGINRHYLQNFGYNCAFFTDTEVIAYLFDLLVRKHGLSFEITAKILSAPFWSDIERMPEKERELYEALRIVYGPALLNGPFGVIAANNRTMVGLNDRIKLRPLVAARHGEFVYIASEESAIREICPHPDTVWMPKAGEPVIARARFK
ncbi:glutamine amidotransferase family protein [bacterium]|nr:glutamine amidotransferase family protein [bacterium]